MNLSKWKSEHPACYVDPLHENHAQCQTVMLILYQQPQLTTTDRWQPQGFVNQALLCCCGVVQAVGNTFAAAAPDLSPKVSASTRSITFPACRLGEAVAQTLLLKNYGTTPAAFALTCSGGESGPVMVTPSRGVLPPNSTTVVSGCWEATAGVGSGWNLDRGGRGRGESVGVMCRCPTVVSCCTL
jgi:hypothetical protein